MADDDVQEVIVSVDDDGVATEVTGGDGVEAKTKTPDPAEELKAQFAELQAREERERQGREQAQREAAQAREEANRFRQEAQSARTEAIDSDYNNVVAGLESAKVEAEAAEAEYRRAYEAGDAAAMAAAQRKIARAEARSVRLDEAKADIEARKSQQTEKSSRRTDATQTDAASGDPIEAFIATRTPTTQKWLREHKDWLTDQKKNNKLTAAHFTALGEGLNPDTEEYFAHVETILGIRKGTAGSNMVGGTNGANEGDRPRTANGQFRKAAPPVAPVAQSGGGTSGTGDTVRLTKKEVEAAQDGTIVWNYDDPSGKKRYKKGDPIGLAEFARRKNEMQKQGLYDKSYTES